QTSSIRHARIGAYHGTGLPTELPLKPANLTWRLQPESPKHFPSATENPAVIRLNSRIRFNPTAHSKPPPLHPQPCDKSNRHAAYDRPAPAGQQAIGSYHHRNQTAFPPTAGHCPNFH